MTTDSDAVATIAAIRNGDLAELQRLLRDNPGLAASRLKIAKGRTPLHVVSDWPGYFPSGPRVAKALIDAGAVVDVRSTNDEHGETPLHWTASSENCPKPLVVAGWFSTRQLAHPPAHHGLGSTILRTSQPVQSVGVAHSSGVSVATKSAKRVNSSSASTRASGRLIRFAIMNVRSFAARRRHRDRRGG
jgi:hypothetical protein